MIKAIHNGTAKLVTSICEKGRKRYVKLSCQRRHVWVKAETVRILDGSRYIPDKWPMHDEEVHGVMP